MSNYRKLLIAGAAALALTLAGCGGGGDDTTEAPTVTEPTGPTQEELDAAQAAAEEAAAQAAAEQAAREAAEQELADKEAADAETTATTMGKQLHRAMGATPLANLMGAAADTAVTPNQAAVSRSSLSTSGVTVGYTGLVAGANDGEQVTRIVPSPLMKASGDALDAVNGWEGQHYSHTLSGTSNEARVYTFKAATPGKPAAEVFGDDRVGTDGGTNFRSRPEIPNAQGTGGYDSRTRVLTFIVEDPTSPRFMSDAFPAAGTNTHKAGDDGAIAVEGTYDGVPGTYRCVPTTPADGCSTTKQAGGGGILLDGGAWSFKHESGATTSVPDTAFQYFGWWLRKVDGVPSSASAIFGSAGSGTQTMPNAIALNGSATYSGSAAGKWANDDPIAGSGSAGHFTADVALSAKFGADDTAGNESGISGSLTNFMANEEAVDWMVTLTRADWDGEVDDTNNAINTGTFSGGRTVWTIDGNKADASGSWNGQLLDDGNPNSNAPTAIVGGFHSEAGSAWRMVGGFGARQD